MKSWIDIAVILAYLAGTTLFGCSFFFRKDSGDARAFVAGGGKLPGWAIALSVFATYVSSISFLALPAKAYLTNWKIRGQALRDSEIILKQAANNRLIEDFLSFLKGLSLRKGNGEMVVRLMISYDDCKDGLRVYYM